MLDFKRLTLLRELQLRGSIAATARVIGISASAVSQQLAKLETEAGLPLLEQVGRKIQLTPAARQLVSRVDEAVMVLEGAAAELEARSSRVQGVIRFVAFGTFARTYLPETLRRLSLVYPDVVVEFTQLEPFEALDALASRRADIAIVDEFTHIPRRTDEGLVRTLVTRDRVDIFLPHPIFNPVELGELHWAFEPRGTDAYLWTQRFCRELGFEPKITFDSPDPRLHYELVAAGVAAAFLPHMVFGGEIPSHGTMTRWLPPDAELEQSLFRDIYAVGRRGSHLRPAVRSFLEILCEVAA